MSGNSWSLSSLISSPPASIGPETFETPGISVGSKLDILTLNTTDHKSVVSQDLE